MFGKKESEIKAPELDIKIAAMPDDFYGGSDPTVKFKKTEQTVNLDKFASPLKPYEKKALDTATAKGPGSLFSNTKFWIFGALLLFILFAIGGGIYYWLTLRKKPVQIVERPTITTPVQEIPVVQTPTSSDILEPVQEEPVVVPPKEIGFELPSKILPVGNDLDQDGVFDASEEAFASDPGNPDTDGDGYSDSHELFYLYNPAGVEPQKLVDSGMVSVYKNNNYGYELYHPKSWVMGSVDQGSSQALFSALSGENIEVRVFDMPYGQTFEQWFAINAPADELLSDYSEFVSRFETVGKKRFDGLVYFFVRNNQVVSLIYHLGGNSVVNHKTVLEVMARSFVFTKIISIYEQPPVLPEEFEQVAESLFNGANMEETEVEEDSVEQGDEELEEEPVFQEEIGEQFIDFIEEQETSAI